MQKFNDELMRPPPTASPEAISRTPGWTEEDQAAGFFAALAANTQGQQAK